MLTAQSQIMNQAKNLAQSSLVVHEVQIPGLLLQHHQENELKFHYHLHLGDSTEAQYRSLKHRVKIPFYSCHRCR